MARKKGKLKALQRSYEVEERSAAQHKREVEVVVEERRKVFEELLLEKQRLEVELKKVRTQDRASALVLGDAQQLLAFSRYEARLKRELKELDVRLEQREHELQQAADRAELAGDELVAARIEKKKVERFLEQKAESVRVRDAASEEAEVDESSFYRGKGKR